MLPGVWFSCRKALLLNCLYGLFVMIMMMIINTDGHIINAVGLFFLKNDV